MAGGQRSRPFVWPAAGVLPAASTVEYRCGLVACESFHLCSARRVRLDHESRGCRFDRVLRQCQPSADGTSVAIETENFDDAIKRLKDRQVPFAAEPFESPCCHMAVVQDPDGNKLIIHKLKPENEKEPCP